MRSRVAVILNEKAGDSAGEERIENVKQAFLDAGLDATFHLFGSGKKLDSIVHEALDTGAEIVAAGGGDGTISGVVNEIVGTEKTLAVLPLGTLNHFSKDLGIPPDIHDAVKVISENCVREIDVSEVNGRYFINNSSIGLYPRLVLTRERRERLGYGKWWAAAWALTRIVRWSPFQKVKLELEGNEFLRKVPFVFVGNNVYEMELYNIGTRSRLDEGKLCVYLLRRSGRIGLGLLVLHTVFGGLKESKYFESFNVKEVKIETRKQSTLVAMDGEVTAMESPLEYRIHPRKLKVLVPAEKG